MLDSLADRCPTIAFVAHKGPLEPQAALLAASLHDAYLPAKVVCRTVAPEGHWGALGPDLADFLASLGIETWPCENPISLDYVHGNKLGALAGIAGRALFLDTDIMLMTPFSYHHQLTGEAAAKPADVDTFSNGGGSWARVWSLFDRDVPPKIYRGTVSGHPMRPYYNAGFILAEDGDRLAETWSACARRIDEDKRIRNKRPWLDQIALPVAFAELDWTVEPLSDAFNYPCHLARISTLGPYFAHYHYPRVIADEPKLAFRFASLLSRYPPLAGILSRFEGWKTLVGRFAG